MKNSIDSINYPLISPKHTSNTIQPKNPLNIKISPETLKTQSIAHFDLFFVQIKIGKFKQKIVKTRQKIEKVRKKWKKWKFLNKIWNSEIQNL